MDVLEKLFPIIFLIIWSIIAAQARKRKQRQMEEEEEALEHPVERPHRQQPPPPRKQAPHGGESVFETLKRSIESVSAEMEGRGATPSPAPAQKPKKDMRSAEEDRSRRMQAKARLGKSRIEEATERTEGRPLRRSIREIEPLEGLPRPKPAEAPRVSVGVRIEQRDLEPAALQRAVVLKEILDTPLGLR
jgi:hypothetical protein